MQIMEALTARMLAVSEIVPMEVYRVLLPHERRVSSTRQHPAILLGPLLLAAAGLVTAAVLSLLAADGATGVLAAIWVIWAVLLLRLVLKIGDWTASFFVVTSVRIIMVSGSLRRKVDIIPLGTVNDMVIDATPLGSLFGCADLAISVGAPDQITYKISYLPEAQQMYLRIASVIFPPKSIPCPLCRGVGTAFQPPDTGDANAFETMSEDSGAWDGYLAPGNGRSAANLVAAGYREAECPGCHGRGTVYADGISSREDE